MNVRKLLTLSLLAVALNTEAEIYRWVDKDGKVHFTDRKPAPEAENITKEVKPQNIDTSSNELNKIAAMRAQEEAEKQARREQQAQREQQARKPQMSEQRKAECSRANKRLKDISGYVVFTNEQGRSVTVTEKERQQMVTKLKEVIKANCS